MAAIQKHINLMAFQRIAVILYVMFYYSIAVTGQDPNDRLVIDDLRAELSSTNELSVQTEVLHDFCLYYQVKDYQVDSVIHYAKVLLALAERKNYPIAAILGHRMLGSQYTRISRYEDGRIHLYKSMDIARDINYTHYLFDSYNPLAKNYFQENKLDSALYYFNKSIDHATGMHSKLSIFHVGIATVYGQLGRYEMQEKHLQLSYDNSVKADIRLDQIIALTGILDFYSVTIVDPIKFNKYKKMYDELMSYYSNLQSNFHSNFIFLDSLSTDDHIDFLITSLADNKKTGYIEGVYFNYLKLQELLIESGQYKECAELSLDAIEYYNSQNGVRLEILVDIYKNKWISESKLDNAEQAFETVEYYHYLKDSLIVANNSESINELSLKYETAIKDAKISEMSIKNYRRTTQRNYALFASGLLLVLGLYFWIRFRYKQRQILAENRLQAERITNLEKEKMILSLTSMLEGQEAERTRIAQDLHDGLGGLLSSVRNHFSLIEVEVKKLDKLNVYDRTNSMIDQACKEVRRISHNLMPASLQLNGLVATVQQYCQDILNTKKLEVQFEQTGMDNFRLEEAKEIFIYRIIQEAVTNALKHAEAKTLLVQLGYFENDVTLIIEDDGVGFIPDITQDGIGLKSIKSRVEHLNGHLDVDSRIGEGTTITINIPHE